MEKKNKKGSLADRIPHQVWLLISFAAAMALWTLLSVIPATSRAFPNVFKVLGSIKTMIDRGVLWNDISSSLISVVSGYALGFVIALPVAILMAWYKPVRYIIEPWILIQPDTYESARKGVSMDAGDCARLPGSRLCADMPRPISAPE